MRLLLYIFVSFLSFLLNAQENSLFTTPKNKKNTTLQNTQTITHNYDKDSTETEITINTLIDGTLLVPNTVKKPHLAILIAGSGPTDRNGNQNFLKNNAIKKIAVGLLDNGIASFRYDKRIVKQIKQGNVDNTITFDDFVTDAVAVIQHFKASKQFHKIYLLGHSQGSLVSFIAANTTDVDGIISLAGAGQAIDGVIKEQINKTAPMFNTDTEVVLKALKSGKTTDKYPKALASIFNKDVQPFMISWMRYDPAKEIERLTIPVLIINGTKDLQVSEREAELLKQHYPNAQLKLVENMNHVLVTVNGDDLDNSKTYNKPKLPLADGLIEIISNFITQKDN